jgi:hypothetical protein
MWMGQALAFGCASTLKNAIQKCPPASYRSLLAVGTALSLAASLAIGCTAQVSVSTYHNNKQRTGGNTLETALTPSNVNSTQFGKLYSQAVDGFIYAQPLYMPNVNIAGLGIHNVVYVATMNDSVYAFDADSKTGGNAYPLWHVSFINAANGITPIPYGDIQCTDPISTKIGIMGTPVIDTVGGTLYVLVRTKEWGQYFQRLHALDITSGAEKFGGPVAIQARALGHGTGSFNGTVSFNPKIQNQRAALLLQNGLVYIGWGSHCDLGLYHGWLMAYDAKLLVQRAVWVTAPNGEEGAIWESGSGPAADATYTYVAIANGTFDANTGGADYGQSIVKLNPLHNGALSVADYFTPYDGPDLNVGDHDIGSGGAMLLPDQPNGPYLHLLVQGDKAGNIYLVNRDGMGHFNPQSNSQIVQYLPGADAGMWNSPTWWNNHVYFGGGGDYLKSFSFNTGTAQLSTTPTSQTANRFGYPGTTTSVSSNQSSNAVLWALDNSSFKLTSGAVLYAYDATNLGTLLYSSDQYPVRDNPGPAVKFTVPTVANGKVYVGTRTRLSVYGLLPPPAQEAHSRSKPAQPSGAGLKRVSSLQPSSAPPGGSAAASDGGALRSVEK